MPTISGPHLRLGKLTATRSVSTADTEIGIDVSLTQAGAGIGYGIKNYLTHSGSASAAAIDIKVTSSGTGNRDHIVAVQAVAQHSSTGTISQVMGGEVSVTVSDNCQTTDAIGWHIDAPSLLGAAGTRAVNNTGLLIEDQTSARATSTWALRTLGTALSQFGGLVQTALGFKVTGVNFADAASMAVLGFLSGSANLYSYGADTSTNGTFSVLLRRSDGSNSITAMAFAVTGAVTFASSVMTSAPAGVTARPWKLGEAHSVSPTSPNRTLSVDVNGVVYYIHAKTTND